MGERRRIGRVEAPGNVEAGEKRRRFAVSKKKKKSIRGQYQKEAG